MTIPVDKVVIHLLDSLIQEGASVEEIKTLSESIGEVAFAYPVVWSEVLRDRLGELKPSLNQSDWVLVLSHLSCCKPFPALSDKQIEPIVEHCVTSIYSVDISVREAGLAGLRAICQSNLRLIISKIAFSLKIYTLNEQVVELIGFMASTPQKDSGNIEKILNLIYILLSEEGAVKPELLGDLACCVAPCCSYPDSLGQLSQLCDLLTPMCWRKDLVSSNSSALFGIFKAVAALIAIVPAPQSTVHAVQSGILRLLVHTKSSEELIRALEAVEILIVSGHFLTSTETCNACIPILIDIGIAVGPLGLLGPVDDARTVQRALYQVWREISPKGFGFILERASHASQLSMVDRIVTLVYLNWAIQGKKFANERIDVLVTCIDSLCALYSDSPPYLALCVVDLVATACGKVPDFLLTVPIIDFVISLSVKANPSSEAASIKTYWFSPSSIASKQGGEGWVSERSVQTRAQTVIVLLAESAGRDSVFALKERLVDCIIKTLPVEGIESLVRALVRIGERVSDLPTASKLIAWSAVHLDDQPSLVGELAKLTVGPLPWSKSRDSAILELIFEIIFSKKFLEKTPNFSKALIFVKDLIPSLPNGCAGRTLIQCLQKCDQEIHHGYVRFGYEFLSLMSSVIGCIPFAEFTHVMTEMTAHLHKSRNRLIVLMGLKKDSNEIIFALLRLALGYSATAKLSDLVPVLKDMYLEPCFETIREVRTDPTVLAVQVTLETLVRVVPVVSSVLIQTDGGEFVNALISSILPLVVFQSPKETSPAVVRLAMEAVTALASVPQLTLSTSNFDQAMQYSVSVLVHGISSFNTLEIEPYSERITSVSNLLRATLRHSFNIWLGLSRLAQLLQMAGAGSPLPILRVICVQVFSRTIPESLFFDESKSSVLEWIECCVLVIPRLKDPTTELSARAILDKLLDARQISRTETFTNKDVVPDKLVLAFIQLLLHAAAIDGEHRSTQSVLGLLTEVILQRGPTCITPQDSPGLVSIMLGYADRQPLFLECVHAISSIHLSASLTEIVTEAVTSGDQTLSDSQVGAIQSIAKEKRLLVGFVAFMTDLVNNSEPCADGALSPEATVAAMALDVALSVQDSLVPAMVSKYAAPLFGTAILFTATGGTVVRRDKTRNITVTVLKRLGVTPRDAAPDELLSAFLGASSDEAQVAALAEFFIPFMKRDARGMKCMLEQRLWAERFLAAIVGRTDKLRDSETVGRIKDALREVGSVRGLEQMLLKRKTIFSCSDLELVITIMQSANSIDTVSACLDVLLAACDAAAKMSGSDEWRCLLLTTAPLVDHVLSQKLVSDDLDVNRSLFIRLLNLVIGLCDVAGIAPDATAFKKAVTDSLMLEINIRSHVLEDLGEVHSSESQLGAKCLISLRRLCPEKEFDFENDFSRKLWVYLDSRNLELHSMSSPSRSPLVTKGAARLAVEIANSPSRKSTERAAIVRTLLRFVRTQKKSFAFDAAKEHVIAALGDLDLTLIK